MNYEKKTRDILKTYMNGAARKTKDGIKIKYNKERYVKNSGVKIMKECDTKEFIFKTWEEAYKHVKENYVSFLEGWSSVIENMDL